MNIKLLLQQVFYYTQKGRRRQKLQAPDLKKIRPVIFWDTRMEGIDWHRQYKAVIKRVFERGNEKEKKEITRFYGKRKVEEVLSKENK